MKKLIKPFRSERELQLVSALCEEYGECSVATCQTFRHDRCSTMATCYGQSHDLDIEEDILF
jgi:hypothetical protein